MAEIVLEALNGGNPLAYLAAIGTLRIATLAWPGESVRLNWKNIGGWWRPCIHDNSDMDIDKWLKGLCDTLKPEGNEARLATFSFSPDLNLKCQDFRAIAQEAQHNTSPEDRIHADYVAAFGSESVELLINGKKSGLMSDTALRTMSGAGHQHFLGFMLELVKVTKQEDISHSLFDRWNYSDPGPSLRWDPADDRRYALRWSEPSGDPLKTIRGANRLAIEALPLFPTIPYGKRLETTSITQHKRNSVFLTWPIWTKAISMDVVRSLLALPELQHELPNRKKLQRMGVEEIYRSQRITQGKYRNFTIAFPV